MAVSEDSFSSLSRGFIKGVFEISCFRKQTQRNSESGHFFLVYSSLFLLALKRGGKTMFISLLAPFANT